MRSRRGNSIHMVNTQPEDQTIFSVMTINIRFGLARDGQNAWERRKDAFVGLFEKYRPDFICMQEVNGFQADFFTCLLSEYGSIGRRLPAPAMWQDVLIFYKKRWKCLRHQRFFLSDTPDVPSRMPESKWPRQCVMGEFARGNARVVCTNTHFDFDTRAQVKSAAILLDRLETFASAGAPTVITGDFNAGPGSRCHTAFTDPALVSPPFSDVFADSRTGTYHGFTGKPLSERIDWILWRNMKGPVERNIIMESFDGIFPSDHFPVYAVFGIGIQFRPG